MTDLDKLEKLAKAATPGPWQSFDEEGECYSTAPATGAFLVEYGASVDQRMKDVHFIASANPAAVLALIADHRAVLARIAKVEALADAAIAEHSGRPGSTHYESCWKYHAGCFATALKATLTEGENE